MAVVQDYYNGPTHIVIMNDSCCSPEEVDKILKRISERASRALFAAEQRKDKTA